MVYADACVIENNNESEESFMPQISYNELQKTISEIEKKFNGLPEDNDRKTLLDSIKRLSSAMNPFNSLTATAKLTTQEQRSEIYGEMQQYLTILADDNKFGGSTTSTKAKIKDLDELNKSGAALNNLLSEHANKAQFSADITTIIMSLSTISSKMSERVKKNDIGRYINNIDNISKKASSQITAKNDTGRDLLVELSAAALLINSYKDEIINPDSKLKAVKAASVLATFYNDNILGNSKKDLFSDQNKSKEFYDDLEDFKNANKAVLDELKNKNKDYAAVFKKHVNDLTKLAKDDWKRRVDEAANDMTQKHEQEQKEEKRKIAERINPAEPVQDRTEEQISLQRAIEKQPYQYTQLPYLDIIMGVLGIDGTKSPLMDNTKNPPEPATYTIKGNDGKTITKTLSDELIKLKQSAIKLASETSSHYSASNQDVKYLTPSEISSLNKTILRFETACDSFSRLLKQKNIMPDTQKTLKEATKSMKRTSYAVHQANKYIQEYYTDKNEKGLFSMYELHGKMNPSACGKLLEKFEWEESVFAKAFEKDLKNGKALRNNSMTSVDGKHKTFAKNLYEKTKNVNSQLKNLTEKHLKPIFSLNNDYLVVNPITIEQVKTLNTAYKETEKALKDFVDSYEDYHFKKNPDGSLILKDGQPLLKSNGPYNSEMDLYNSMKEMHTAIAEKSRLLSYLCDDNDYLKEKVSNFDKLPPDKKNASKEAAFYNYVLGCKANLDSGTLLPQYLLDDPSSPRMEAVLGMMNGKANIERNDKLEKELTETKWVNGKRSLDHIAEMEAKRLQNASHNKIYQFAENDIKKNNNLFRSIVSSTIDSYSSDEDRTVKYTDSEGNKREFDILKKIQEFQNKLLPDPEHDDLTKTFSPNNDGTFDGGFKGAFTQEEIDAGGEFLERVVTELNRNMYNAGLCKDAIIKLDGKSLPAGYNEGFARALVSEMDTMGLYPIVSMYKEENRNKYKIPHSNGKGSEKRTTPVQLANVQGNFNTNFEKYNDKLINQEVQPKYYTTPKNFRSSTFVRDRPMDPNQKLAFDEAAMEKYFKGKSPDQIQKQIKTFEDNIAKKNINPRKDWADPYTTSVRDYKTFHKPDMIKRAADLQINDYIFGIPKRGTDDIRIEFQTFKDEKGYQVVKPVGISGANSDNNLPLATGFGEDKNLFNPENMLVISSSMASKVNRIVTGSFTDQEKELMKNLPKENIDMMKVRALEIQRLIKNEKDMAFNDLVDENGKLLPDGIATKPGVIRVLTDEQFEHLNLDTLTLGMSDSNDIANVSYSERYKQEPKNMFDTLAAMPYACHEALKDKEKVYWVIDKPNYEMHTQYKEAEIIMVGHMAQVEQVRDIQFNMLEAEHLLDKTRLMGREQAKMYNDRKSEKWFHKLRGDSDEFIDVCEALADLEKTAFETKLLKEQEEVLSELGEEGYKESLKKKKPERGEEVFLENMATINENRKTRWEKFKKLCADKGVEAPEKRPPAGHDPSIFIEVMEKNEEVCKKIETYLLENPNPSSELGKVRRTHMKDIYNKINKQMSEYAYLTGITTYPIRLCEIGENGKIKFVNCYKNRYDFEKNGVHPMVQNEYENSYLTSNKADKKKVADYKKELNWFKNASKEEKDAYENKRRNETTYAIPKDKKSLKHKPTMNKEQKNPYAPKEIKKKTSKKASDTGKNNVTNGKNNANNGKTTTTSNTNKKKTIKK